MLKLKNFILFVVIFLGSVGLVKSQISLKKQGIIIPPSICYASNKTEKSFTPPPPEFLQKSGTGTKSEFTVTYSLFPENAKKAFEYALSIWAQLIDSRVPIRIKANWRSQETNILASAGPSDYISNFKYAPHTNRYYPVALVEKITETEISGSGVADIDVTFNKDIKWYYGTDGQTPDQLYDFVTVALHEIGHGLGFTGFFFVTGNIGAYGNDTYGDIAAFDVMVVDANSKSLIDTSFYKLGSTNLYNAFVSQSLFSNSSSAQLATPGNKIKLYAPSTYNDGSSIYHLDDATYNYGNENSLMTHAIGKGEAVHNPGPVTLGVLADIGWKIMKLDFDKPHDFEKPQPIDFRLAIKSDYPLDSSKLLVYYSYDLFSNRPDSVLLIPDGTTGQLKATIIPDLNTKRIDYYVSAGDKMNRIFKLPTQAPAELYTVFIGPDNKIPEISHSPPPYLVLNGNKLQISATVTDNVGVDTVTIDYSVNGKPGSTFGMMSDSKNIFTGFFPIPQNQLNDGDKISYQIKASDISVAKNTAVSPSSGTHSFVVEKVFNAVGGYVNDFNFTNSDFIIADFKIYTADNFLNPSLHSPHPYLSPNKNNSNINLTTMLKYPIILKQNGTMSFDEVVLVEPGEVLAKFGDDDFYDYVITEGSKDNGKTWIPLADGYDSGDNTTWKTNYNKEIVSQVSKAVGRPEWYFKREINLLSNGNFKANDTILIRFRLYSDPYANGWGWTIDNLRIQNPVSNQDLAISSTTSRIYPNPFKDIVNVYFKTHNNLNSGAMVEIYSLQGQKLYNVSEENTDNEFTLELNLQILPPGIYIAKVTVNGTNTLIQKIVKQ